MLMVVVVVVYTSWELANALLTAGPRANYEIFSSITLLRGL